MSPDEPKYLPADAAAQPEPNVQPLPQPPSMYDGWDRGDARQDRATDLRLPPSNSLFRYLEVAYPWRPRLPLSVLWAVPYVGIGFFVVLFFLIFAQVIPAIGALVLLIFYNIAQMGAEKALSSQGMKNLEEQSMAPTLIAGHIAAISLALIFLRFLLGPDWLRRLAVRLPGLWHLLLTLLLVPALVVLATGAFGLAKQYLPNMADLTGLPMPGMEKMVQLFGKWPWWLGILVVGVGPALGEELWCRGLIGLGLLGRNGVVARLLVSAFYFGVLHVDPQQGSMAAILGLVLYFVLLTTRCFWMPVLIHFCINSISVIGARFESTSAIDQRPEDLPLLLYAAAFVLFVTLAVSLFRTRARLVNTLAESSAATGQRPEDVPLTQYAGAFVLFMTFPLLLFRTCARLMNTLGDSSAVWQPTYAGLEHPPAHSGVVVQRPRPDLIDLGLVALGVGSFVAALVWTVYFG